MLSEVQKSVQIVARHFLIAQDCALQLGCRDQVGSACSAIPAQLLAERPLLARRSNLMTMVELKKRPSMASTAPQQDRQVHSRWFETGANVREIGLPRLGCQASRRHSELVSARCCQL